ncbi:hypothetical protein C8R44DRAFT_860188 [Mycena epipterygia]|nr:hypothetical protein C8R44DRAFT_860188 [Mycena epipterygia]
MSMAKETKSAHTAALPIPQSDGSQGLATADEGGALWYYGWYIPTKVIPRKTPPAKAAQILFPILMKYDKLHLKYVTVERPKSVERPEDDSLERPEEDGLEKPGVTFLALVVDDHPRKITIKPQKRAAISALTRRFGHLPLWARGNCRVPTAKTYHFIPNIRPLHLQQPIRPSMAEVDGKYYKAELQYQLHRAKRGTLEDVWYGVFELILARGSLAIEPVRNETTYTRISVGIQESQFLKRPKKKTRRRIPDLTQRVIRITADFSGNYRVDENIEIEEMAEVITLLVENKRRMDQQTLHYVFISAWDQVAKQAYHFFSSRPHVKFIDAIVTVGPWWQYRRLI